MKLAFLTRSGSSARIYAMSHIKLGIKLEIIRVWDEYYKSKLAIGWSMDKLDL